MPMRPNVSEVPLVKKSFWESEDRLTINTMNFIPDEMENDLRTLIDSQGGAGEESIGQDYVVYQRMFSESFLLGLLSEMKWLEEHYGKDFIDSMIKRSSGDTKEEDLKSYHRVSKVYWLTFVRESDYQYVPNLVKFKNWIKLFRASINRQLFEAGHDYEVANIEEQYILYENGGKFEPHLDTQCNPLRNCEVKEHHYPRLLTWLIFLNPGWTESDGGVYKTYYNWPKLDLKEVVSPTLGKTVLIRADKVYHSGELVNTSKRAITLFVNVKPIVNELPQRTEASQIELPRKSEL